MEATEMEGTKKPESHLTSASAFVEGGIQDACDDACSICLEEFSESDPSTVTCCKHEFHLQCILEWCQRSSQCPMCWQDLRLKDPTSQELLEGVERERKIRATPSRNATIFHHPTLGDFELHNLPIGSNDELEERIIQHLAAAAAVGRVRHITRREGHRNGTPSHGRRHYLVFSPHPDASTHGETEEASTTLPSPSAPLSHARDETLRQTPRSPPAQPQQNSSSASGSNSVPMNRQGLSLNSRHDSGPSSATNQDRAGPSELQSLSESLKSRFNMFSSRYKESISRSARGWKERFFSRPNSMSDIGSEVRREVNAGIASVSRMMERLENRDNGRANQASSPRHPSSLSPVTNQLSRSNHNEAHRVNSSNSNSNNHDSLDEINPPASHATGSVPA